MSDERMPHRVQQSRVKGWRKPDNTVSVTRPGKFGNPFAYVGKLHGEGGLATMTRQCLVDDFRSWLLWTQPTTTTVPGARETRPIGMSVEESAARRAAILDNLHLLRGKNLMCFCDISQPCHSEVLLELANSDRDKNGARP